MKNNDSMSFDAYLACKDLSSTELLNILLNSNTQTQYETARRLQFFRYREIKDIVKNVLLTSQYSRHRELAVFILGQIQNKLDKSELEEVLSLLIHFINNDKSINVKSSAISSLGHLFHHYDLGEEEFRAIEEKIKLIWQIHRYSIVIATAFSSAFFPKRDYIEEYLIKNLNSRHPKVISWIVYALKEKSYYSKSIETLLLNRLDHSRIESYIYIEIAAYLISINCEQIIPYIEDMVLTQNKIDDEIYIALKNNSSKSFSDIRKIMLGKFQ